MLRATAEQWRACANVLRGQPAFILGNGPDLPRDLACLADLFTVGTNRIVWKFDPTVLMWFDPEIVDPAAPQNIAMPLAACRAVPFTRDEINWEKQWNDLAAYGTSRQWVDQPLCRPDMVPCTGNSGASAAYWAMSLGCRPVYLLGMSASYDGGRTNYYGRNGRHTSVTLRQLRRALARLLSFADVYPIQNQRQLDRIAAALRCRAKGRRWYCRQFATRHSGVRAGQRPAPADGPVTLAEAVHHRGQPDLSAVQPDGGPVGRFERVRHRRGRHRGRRRAARV